ncbi:MAG: tetratricopeptide repeat protein [Deltaproteobacteria bacterium]|jgi:tetratricopeptide (TPR) repeat protein|nr:tetratricopeptide repeat protein [Deltaproteobacteria bacterium]
MAKQVPIKSLLRSNDAFLSTSDKLYHYFKNNKGKIFIIIGIALAIFLAFYIVKSLHDSRLAKSLEAFHKANTLSELDQRYQALQAVRQDYAGTKAARQAAYALLNSYLAQADLEEALPLLDEILKSLDSSEQSLKPLLLTTQAGLFEQIGQLDLALDSYRSALALIDRGQINPQEAPYVAELYSSLGRVYMALGRFEEAKKAYQDILLRTPNSYRAYTAQVKLSQLQEMPLEGDSEAPEGDLEAAPADDSSPEASPATSPEAAGPEATGPEAEAETTQASPGN